MNIELNGRAVTIDDECVDFVLFFNRIGLKTKFSCCGHGLSEFSIMFTKDVTDKQIEDFILKYRSDSEFTPFIGTFSKWLRKLNGKLQYNWVYACPTIEFAKADYVVFREVE